MIIIRKELCGKKLKTMFINTTSSVVCSKLVHISIEAKFEHIHSQVRDRRQVTNRMGIKMEFQKQGVT
jgi:hypothetical protein